jgi:hypothetical protein
MSRAVINAYPPYDKQQEILDYILEPSPIKKQVDLCCGRGFGKTYLAVILAAKTLSLNGSQAGLFLEPDWASINSIFWEVWNDLIPKELYTVNKGQNKITWANGSVLFYGPRSISGSVEAMRDKYKGRNLTFVIDDEAAIGCDEQMYTNTLGSIRKKPTPVRYYFTISTPKVGPYKRLITGEKHVLFRGSSRDNPYLPPDYVDNLIANMSRDQARREIDGEFVSLEGRIWKTADLTKDWPSGNTHETFTKFDPNKPWWLMCDLGSATGSYIVIQQTDASFRGSLLFKGPVWVAVADFCPQRDASAARAFAVLKEHFGTPSGVTAGADVNTRATTDGTTVSYFAQQTWGNVPIYPCNESIYSKMVQYDNLSYLMCSAIGQRRFTIARDFVELDPDSHRGVKQMVEEDEWPDESKRRMSDFLPKHKENIVQHTRDALLMGFAQLSPPSWAKTVGPA